MSRNFPPQKALAALVSIVGIALLLLTGPASADPEAPPVVVSADFARRVPNIHSMVGFLHGSNATTPGDDRLLPLRPALWRIGFQWMNNRDRLAKLGIPTILILSDLWGSRVPKDRGEWEGFVRAMIKNADGLPFIWDVMNEPDLSTYFKGTPEQYSEMFVQAAQILHQQPGPGTRVSGPSISHYDPQYLGKFLDDCKARYARVDVLSWHELSDDSDVHAVTDHLRDARKRFVDNPAYKSLGIRQIQINEIVGPTAQYWPGEILGYFDALEQGGADGACKGCWNDSRGQSNCVNNTLDGLLTPDTHQPRAAWWACKSYADTVATRVASRSFDPRIVSFAALGDRQAATLLVGCVHDPRGQDAPIRVSLHLTGLARLAFSGANRRVHVRVQKIPDTGDQAVDHLTTVQEEDVAVLKGAATVSLPPLTRHEAAVVSLSSLR